MQGLIQWVCTMVMASAGLFGFMGCSPTEPNELDKLGTVDLPIKGKNFRLWIADSDNERTKGLMFITADQMAPLPDGTRRGMIFVFETEQQLNFWMRKTIIPLDIAYVDSTSTVVMTHTMAPLDERLGQYPSVSPARAAIEVYADTWREIGLKKGDTIEIPPSLLNRTR